MMKIFALKRVLIILLALVVVGISAFLVINREGGPEEYIQNDNITAEGGREYTAQGLTETEISREIIDILIDQNDELNLTDVIYTLNDSWTEQFLLYYDTEVGVDNQNVSQAERETLLKNFIEFKGIPDVLNQYTQYTLSDLTILGTNEKSVSQYIDGFNTALTLSISLDTLRSDLEVFIQAQNASKETREQAATELQTNARIYNQLLTLLLGLKTPTEVAGRHLDLVNSLSLLTDRVGGMSYISTDPLRARLYAEKYIADVDMFPQAYTAVQQYIQENSN